MGVEVVGVIASSSMKNHLGFSSGFYTRGLFYKILRSSDPSLASTLHGYKGLAPFSASPLLRLEDGIYYFRFASFDSRITNVLLDFFKKFDEVELLNSRFYLKEIVYKNIDLRRLLSEAKPFSKYEVSFESPTCFRRPCPYIPLYTLGPIATVLRFLGRPRSTYRYYPLPDPVLMLRSLARLWREYGGVTIRFRKFSKWLEEGGVALSSVHNIATHKLIHKRRNAFIVGFTGKVRLSLPSDTFNEECAKVANALLRFGEEVQVGLNRTAGFGLYRIRKML